MHGRGQEFEAARLRQFGICRCYAEKKPFFPHNQMLDRERSTKAESMDAWLREEVMVKPPFDFYEVVTIFPVDLETEPEVVHLTGKRGVITGMADSDETGEWGFSVAIQSGENWYFRENELKSTGIKVSPEALYGIGQSISVRVRVDPETGEGKVVSGDPSLLQRLTPLRINLEELKG